MNRSESQEDLITSAETVRHRIRRLRNQEKWPQLQRFLVDVHGNSFLGDNPQSIVSQLILYTGFYTALVAFFAILLGFFCLTLDEITPRWNGEESPLRSLPGLSYRPVPDFESNLVRFIQGKPETYKPFTDHIQTFLLEYENEAQVGENFIDCKPTRPDDSEEKVCRFEIDDLGGQCTWQKDFGYDEGMPCVLLKTNKVIGWRPERYQSLDEIAAIDPEAADWIRHNGQFDPRHLPVTCNGRYDADIENFGNITIEPKSGFNGDFFPYLNQEGYRAPLVMLKFIRPINGVVINVMCKIWVKNIKHIPNDGVGVITFSLLVD